MPPDLARGKLSIGAEASQLSARTGTAGTAIIGTSGAEHKVAAIGDLRRAGDDATAFHCVDPYEDAVWGRAYAGDESHVDAVTDDWDKISSFGAYDDFTRAWLLACRRVMKPSATIWVKPV